MLLDLPSELLLDIFLWLDAPSLSSILATCSHLRAVISESPFLLRHHLAIIPGFPSDTEGLDGKQLLRRFQSQAALHLQHLGVLIPDIITYSPLRYFDSKSAIVTSCGPPESRHLHIATFCTTDKCVYIYHVDSKTGPTLKFLIEPYRSDVKLILSHLLFLRQGEEKCPYGLTALYYSQVSVITADGDTTPYGRTIELKDGDIEGRRLMLVRYPLDESINPFVLDEECIPIPRCEDSSTLQWPTALAYNPFMDSYTIAATTMNGRLYRSVLFLTKATKQFKATLAENSILNKPHTVQIELGGSDQDAHRDIIASTIQHRRHGLLISPPNFPMPNLEVDNPWERRYRFSHHAIDTSLPANTQESFYRQQLGTTLAWQHICTPDDVDVEFGCAVATLQVLFSIDDRWDRHTGVYLVKGVEGVETCTNSPPTYDPLGEHLIVQHIIVAQLEGIDINNVSSIGIKMCFAPSRRRIAMSNWKSVYVWPIEPNGFLDPYRSSYWDATGDPSFLESCGHEYHENGLFFDDIPVLLPMELPSRGVVYAMEFTNDDELWAWTEQGLVKWCFDTQVNNRRDTLPMEKEPPSLRKRKHPIGTARTDRTRAGGPLDEIS